MKCRGNVDWLEIVLKNAGYGIDKIIKWKELTDSNVKFESDLLISTVAYPLAKANSRHSEYLSGEKIEEINEEINEEIKKVLDLISKNPSITQPKIVLQLGYSKSKVNRIIPKLRKSGLLTREGSNKTGRWVITRRL